MSSDDKHEEVGILVVANNRCLWKIHKYETLRKNCWFRSPKFSLMDSLWELRFRSCYTFFNSPWLLISLIKLSNVSAECQNVRIQLGVSGNNKEISETFDVDDLQRFETAPDTMFKIDFADPDPYLHTQDLHLFTKMENVNKDSTVIATDKDKAKIDKKKSNEGAENACEEQSAEAIEEIGLKNLQQDLKSILQNEHLSDIVLKVGGQEFNCHRCILAARSPVFFAMMKYDTVERVSGIVDIPDIDPDAFSDFLKYLYTGSVRNIELRNVRNLYIIADRYQVYELKKITMDQMLKNVSVDNFCDLFTLSIVHAERDLTDVCYQFFIKNSLSIVKSTNWQIFLIDNPEVANDLYLRKLQLEE